MKQYRDKPFTFDCSGETLVGIVSEPVASRARTGVLIVVGGPSYRVGSHRQFVRLARDLAAGGVACMRFDYRGMGDSSGERRSFETVEDDIRAAMDAFCAQVRSLEQVALWGLCDGASAAAMYAPTDGRVRGVVLVNPWVRNEVTRAKTYLRHYYRRRAMDPGLWRKIGSGKLDLSGSIRSAWRLLRSASRAPGAEAGVASTAFPQRMAAGLQRFSGPIAVLISGTDLIGAEFNQLVSESPAWQAILRPGRATWFALADADHTFSSSRAKAKVAELMLDWLSPRERQGQRGSIASEVSHG